ncbi:MAG: hypothetical protein F8N39_07290 [Clostridiaceae bacterium]|nr:hypothetical protein [Clostridiaceae bacterium]
MPDQGRAGFDLYSASPSAVVETMSFAGQGMEENEGRPLTVIPDANVLIHGKSLPDLPWTELERSTIEVLFVPPVIRELDKLKTQTGRPNKIARQLSSDIRALINAPDRKAMLRRSGPAVSKRVELRSVTEVLNPALRLDHADQALINYALHLKQDGADVLLLTDDTICGTTAAEVGLPTHFLPDHWLREPEPDESGKENAKLKAEIHRLRAAEPKVELSFHDRVGKPLSLLEASITRWPALSEAELDDLMADVKQRCPQATSFERQQPRTSERFGASLTAIEGLALLPALTPRKVYEPATEEEIERYKAIEYPNWLNAVRKILESLHTQLGERTCWPTVLVVAANEGTRPAMEALLGIRVRGEFTILNDESDERDVDGESNGKAPDQLELPLPPTPPRGRVKTVGLFEAYPGFHANSIATALPLGVDVTNFARLGGREADAFYWRAGKRDWVKVMELECTMWRHGQNKITFALKLRPNEMADASGVIELSVQANNISDPPVVRLPVRIGFEDGSTIEEARALVAMLGRSARLQGPL